MTTYLICPIAKQDKIMEQKFSLEIYLIFKLPKDLHGYILTFLDLQSTLRAKKVCKLWSEILNRAYFWEKKCSLENFFDKPEEKSWLWYYLSKQTFTSKSFTGIGQENTQNSNYEGEFLNGKKHGYGTLITLCCEKSVYKGYFENGARQGYGHSLYNDGDYYEGLWKSDFPYGLGTFTWKGTAFYEGPWVNGFRVGFGRYIWNIGDVYEGEFLNSQRSGYGTYLWYDHRYYVGQWKNGYMHGQGYYYWPDGAEYIGEWKESKRHGNGKMTLFDGTVIIGEWIDDFSENEPKNHWTLFFTKSLEEREVIVSQLLK